MTPRGLAREPAERAEAHADAGASGGRRPLFDQRAGESGCELCDHAAAHWRPALAARLRFPCGWFADVERVRALFARIAGADAEGVAIVPATSYGFAVAARNLPLRAGERVAA